MAEDCPLPRNKNMGIFDKRKSIPRKELRGALGKHSGSIPGTGGRKYYQRERERMGREVFGRKYGGQISKNDYRRALRDLESKRAKTKTRREKIKIDEKIRYLRELGGKNI